jgi:hypothetical protein
VTVDFAAGYASDVAGRSDRPRRSASRWRRAGEEFPFFLRACRIPLRDLPDRAETTKTDVVRVETAVAHAGRGDLSGSDVEILDHQDVL